VVQLIGQLVVLAALIAGSVLLFEHDLDVVIRPWFLRDHVVHDVDDVEARREREAKQAEAIKARKRSAELAKAKLNAGRVTRSNAARAEMRAANEHAAKIRNDGTHEPAKAEQPAPKAVETWCAPERHQVTKARPGRYEVLDVPGSFSALKPGQYLSAPASCAARGVA
jgi:hypothetical protein